ncbi:hypothetical protein FA95DRAFT_1612827 [Auriscalpium vulgare]|uniref:Uncharacterized protein n=1 Tax=Auriscalpium vulgare TaxID=40419 RepID=A0ACB8R4T9_9AGAM|nr:hypothetical protein FA95DRAFT_1612827 [Auriscalpium vulgare]
MSTTAQSDSLTPLEAHLLAVLALYEHGPVPASTPAYSGPASPQATEIIDAIARRTRPAAAPTAIPDDWTPPGTLAAPPPALLQQHPRPPAEKELNMLKAQLSDVACVCSAIANGDLQQRITDVVNVMAKRLESVATTALRVAGEMSQGVLGGAPDELSFELDDGWRMRLHGPQGKWVEMVKGSNTAAATVAFLVREVIRLIRVTTDLSEGKIAEKITINDVSGDALELVAAMNKLVDKLAAAT